MHVDLTCWGIAFVNRKEMLPNIPSECLALLIAMASALNHLSPIGYSKQ
jgi:hypothetical protein